MKRAHKAVVAAVVVLASLLLVVIAGQAPRAYLTPADVADDPGRYGEGGPVQVVAVVVDGSVRQGPDGQTHFAVQGDNATLDVVFPRGLSDAFGEGKWVVVTGTPVVDGDGSVVLQAEDVQIGCPSKWDADKDAV